MAARRTKLRFGNHLRLIASFVVMACGPARAAEVWRERAPMPTARMALSASTVDGKIYAIGGSSTMHGAVLSTVDEYDPTTDTWAAKAPMPTARKWLSTSAVNGKIYAFGGTPYTFQPALSTVEEYDPATDTWTEKAPMPTARFLHSTSAVGGKIYAIGGILRATTGGPEPPSSVVEEYDPATDTWTEKAPMPTARGMLSTSVVDGKIYAIGGSTYRAGLSTVEEYDPATDTWTTRAPMPTARITFSSSSVVDEIIYVIGGGSVEPAFSTVEAYDPATDIWTTKADMLSPRAAPATSVVGGKIYAIGGNHAAFHGAIMATVYEYTPSYVFADFNADGIVDGKDVLIMTAHWGEDYPWCDIGPTPYGDGVVDVQDVIVLAEHIGKDVDDPTLLAHWAFDETEGPVAYDSAGENDATVIGVPAWQPDGGCVDGALEFDGATFAVADLVLSPQEGPFSVLTWVKGGAPG